MSKTKAFISKAQDLLDPHLRAAFTISSWFCVPGEMNDFDILSRASGFLINASDPSKFGRKYHFVTASHTVAPWRWPKYYPQDWIKSIDESNTYYTLEYRSQDGIFITQIPFLCRSYHHMTRDLAVLHLGNLILCV